MKKCKIARCYQHQAGIDDDATATQTVKMLSDTIEYKAFDESPFRLRELEEARGQLLQIFEAEGQAVAAFEWGAISLPLDLRDELESLVGREIAILRLDGRYYLREVVAGA